MRAFLIALVLVLSGPGLAGAAEVPGAPGAAALDGLSFRRGALAIAVPHVEARGTALTASELREILDPASALSAAQRLARLSAAEIAAPEVTFSHDPGVDGAEGWTVTLHDLRASGVEAGKAQAVSVASLDGELRPDATRRDAISTGAIAAHAVDPVLALDIVLGSRTDPALPISAVCGDLTVSSFRASPGPADALLVDKLEIAGLRGRPLRDTPRHILHLFDTAPGAMAPGEKAHLYDQLIDAVGSVALDRLAVTGTSLTTHDGALQAFDVGKLEFDDLRPLSLGRFEIGDVDIRASGFHAALRSAFESNVQGETAMTSLLERLFEIQPAGGSGLPGGAARSEARAEGLELDIPFAADSPFPPGTVSHVAIPTLESGVSVSADRQLVEGHLRGRVRYDMPPGGSGPTLQVIRDLGLDRIDASFGYGFSFDANGATARLDELSVDGRDIGSVALSGQAMDLPVAGLGAGTARDDQANLLAEARFQSLSATVVDRGLLGRGLAVMARQSGSTPAQVRAGLEEQIVRGLPDLMGRSRQEAEVAAALGRFLDGGGTLELTARSANGITFREMGEAADPATVAARLDISAKTRP